MTTQLPSALTVDAVPEKRAPDENNQPSSEQENREWLECQERFRNQTSTNHNEQDTGRPVNGCNSHGDQTYNENCSSGSTNSNTARGAKKKEREKEQKKKKYTNVMKIEHSVVQFGNTYHINNNIRMKKSDQPSSSTGKQAQSLPANISEKVLRCNESVSQDDCSIVSEYITCNWKVLGERLFFQEMEHLKDYMTHIEGQSKQAALCTILNRWRQINGSAATVQRLSKILQQLGQITAITKLANRHNIM